MWTLKGDGVVHGVRSEVGTCSAAAMQVTRGMLEGGKGDGRVMTRQRCVWCVRSWWKNVGRSAGKEGTSLACGGCGRDSLFLVWWWVCCWGSCNHAIMPIMCHVSSSIA